MHRWSVGMHQIFSSRHKSSLLVYPQLSIHGHRPLILPFSLRYIFLAHDSLSDLFDFVTFYYIIIHYSKSYKYNHRFISTFFHFLPFSSLFLVKNILKTTFNKKKLKNQIHILLPFSLSFCDSMLDFIF